MLHRQFIEVSKEVVSLINKHKAVISLESAILTHGLPYPENLRLVEKINDIAVKNNVATATVALIEGTLRVGLSQTEIEMLCKNTDKNFIKVSQRDLVPGFAKKLTGGTTVSSTILASNAAGIPIFVTGGIGGVHRGTIWDVSNDLKALENGNVTVISAGVKSILDIESTLEVLETKGVLVATYKAKNFPAFYTPDSGIRSPYTISGISEAVQMVHAKHLLKNDVNQCMLIANPPKVNKNSKFRELQSSIDTAIQSASKNGVSGNKVTPYILEKINELSKGASLELNTSLVLQNVELGCQIATGLSNIEQQDHKRRIKDTPLIVGGTNCDVSITNSNWKEQYHEVRSSGGINISVGGVGFNVSSSLGKLLNKKPLFFSAIGNDFAGRLLELEIEKNCRLKNVKQNSETAMYAALIENNGHLQRDFGNMQIHNEITPEKIADLMKEINTENINMIVTDANIPPETIQFCLKLGKQLEIPASSIPAECLMIKLGKHGVILTSRQNVLFDVSQLQKCDEKWVKDDCHFAWYKPMISKHPIVSESGAGDSLLAGVLAGYISCLGFHDSVLLGLRAADLSLRTYNSVSDELSSLIKCS